MNCTQSLEKRLKKWAVVTLLALAVALVSASAGTPQPMPVPQTAGAPPQRPVPAGQPSPPMADIHDIKPLVHLERSVNPWLYSLIGAAVLAVAGLAIYLLKRRNKKLATTILPAPPPEVVAVSRLDKLNKAENKNGRLFYFRLSAILREYMQGRYGLNAPEMTTEELLPRVDPLELPSGLALSLKQLLSSADPIKFAGIPAVKRKMENDLDFAYTFVEKTTPTDPVTASSDEK